MTDHDALVEIVAKALSDNGEMLTLLDAYGYCEEQQRMPTIGWMDAVSKEMQESIAEAVLAALDLPARDRRTEREVLEELRVWSIDLVAARNPDDDKIYSDGYDTGVKRSITKIDSLITALDKETP